jgi:hypothetical protein
MKWNGFECKQFVPVQKLDLAPVYTSILGEIFDITSIIHASEDENRTRLETGFFCQPSTTYSTKAIFSRAGNATGHYSLAWGK